MVKNEGNFTISEKRPLFFQAMDTSEMLDHIHNVRQAIRYAASDHKGQELPGFSIPKKVQNEPEHDKTNQKSFASREDSDLPGHPPSLISLHCALYG